MVCEGQQFNPVTGQLYFLLFSLHGYSIHYVCDWWFSGSGGCDSCRGFFSGYELIGFWRCFDISGMGTSPGIPRGTCCTREYHVSLKPLREETHAQLHVPA